MLNRIETVQVSPRLKSGL